MKPRPGDHPAAPLANIPPARWARLYSHYRRDAGPSPVLGGGVVVGAGVHGWRGGNGKGGRVPSGRGRDPAVAI